MCMTAEDREDLCTTLPHSLHFIKAVERLASYCYAAHIDNIEGAFGSVRLMVLRA